MGKLFKRFLAAILTMVAGLVLFTNFGLAQTKYAGFALDQDFKFQLLDAEKIPRHGTFWSVQRNFPPTPCYAPFLRELGAPVYQVIGMSGTFLVDDSKVDYVSIYKQRAEDKLVRKMEWELGLMSDAEYFALEDVGGGGVMSYSYSSTDLWIEIMGVTNETAYLTLHGTEYGKLYQLLSKTNLAQAVDWTPGELMYGAQGTNQTDFSPVYVPGVSNLFFRAHKSENLVYLYSGQNAYEPTTILTNGLAGTVSLYCPSPDNVTIYYRVTGTASNGVDYTNLSGQVTIPANANSTNLYIQPLADNLTEGTETVIITLVETNGYLIQQGVYEQTVLVKDTPTTVSVDAQTLAAVETNGPPGASGMVGTVLFVRSDDTGYPAMGIKYVVSGTASNGVDYNFLSGTLNFAENETFKYFDVVPLDDVLPEGIETAVLTLAPSNTYVIDTNYAMQTVTIADSTTTVSASRQQDAIEPHPASLISKQTGIFSIQRTDSRGLLPALTVSYQISGTATTGVDYTNVSGTVTILAGAPSANVFIEPLFDDQIEDEWVKLTLTAVNDNFLINSNSASATLRIVDNFSTNLFQRIATVPAPAGIDYHQPSNSLIVSVNYIAGVPNNFDRIYTNTISSNIVAVVTNWSLMYSVPDEVKLVTVKTTGNGFTNGDMFFGSGNAIGWLSANGTSSNRNWCVLTNSAQTNAMPLRGSLCMDETGLFSNNIIAVTSQGDPDNVRLKGVWRISAQGIPTLITEINTPHLEGVIVLPNDVNNWGPWAGKIVTGDEGQNKIFTIDTNGIVTTYDTMTIYPGGIHIEDFEIIPPNQPLYACDLFGNRVVKLHENYLTNFVGDLMITQAGEYDPPGRLFIVRWDAAITNFTANAVVYRRPDGSDGLFEHVTFAPINIPPLNP